MKKLVLATVVALTATTASAIDVDLLGQTISVGAESDINYVTGIEEWKWTATPYAAFTTSVGVTLSAETEIDMRELDQDEIFKGIDYAAEYGVNGVTLYTEISSDRDWEFGDITVGAKVKF
jgi:hypothetical protein